MIRPLTSTAVCRKAFAVLLGCVTYCAVAACALRADDTDPPQTAAPSTLPNERGAAAGPREVLKFEQSRVAAQMNELEERMYRLSETLRDLEPENASRLLLALKYAREELILLRLKEAEEQLDKPDLAPAVTTQKEALARLKRLHELLSSPDLDFQMKLEELRLLRRLQKRTATASQEQGRLASEAKKTDKPDTRQLQRLRREQAEQRSQMNAISELMNRLTQSGARAQQEMLRAESLARQAEAALEQGDASAAADLQQQAQESLDAAQSDLEEEAQELLDQLQPELRARVVDVLRNMHELQKLVRAKIEEHRPRALDGSRVALASLVNLARAEGQVIQLTDDLVALLDETGFSIALPPSLRVLRPSMIEVQTQLTAARHGEDLIAQARQLENDLAALLETMRDKPLPGARSPGGQRPRDPRSRERELNRLIAELKILRLLQTRVNGRTAAVDRERAAAGPNASADLKRRLAEVEAEQELLRKTAERLQRERMSDNQNPAHRIEAENKPAAEPIERTETP